MSHAVSSVLGGIGVGTAVLVCVSLVFLWVNYAKKNRSAYMRVVAKELGMQFFTFGIKTWRWQSSGFQHHTLNILQDGQEANLILAKTKLASIAVFDWQYVENDHGGDNGFQTQTVVMIEMKGTDDAAIRDFINVDVPAFFASRPCLYFERLPRRVIYFRQGLLGGKKIAIKEMRTFVEEGYSLYEKYVARLSRRAVSHADESVTVARREPPFVRPGYLVLCESLCCVMASDGKVARREKAAIAKVLAEVGAPLDSDQIEAYIADFVSRVKTVGFRRILEDAVEGLAASADQIRNKRMFLQALRIVAKSDDKVDQKETRVIDMLRSALDTKPT